MGRKAIQIFVVSVLLLLALIGCKDTTQPVETSEQDGRKAVIGLKAPAFVLKDHNGEAVNLSDHYGKIVVLEWTNYDCPFVKRHYEAGTMTTLADKFKADGVIWLAINSTEYATAANNKKWVAEQELSYPVLNDSDGAVARVYDARTTPQMYIIDAGGVLVYKGAIDDDPRGAKDGWAINYVDRTVQAILSNKSVEISETKPYGCTVKYSK